MPTKLGAWAPPRSMRVSWVTSPNPRCWPGQSSTKLFSSQLTRPTISAPSTALRKLSTWNGRLSFPAIQLVSRNSAPLTTSAISPRVRAYRAHPMVLMMGRRTALTRPKMTATASRVPIFLPVLSVCRWIPLISSVEIHSANAHTTVRMRNRMRGILSWPGHPGQTRMRGPFVTGVAGGPGGEPRPPDGAVAYHRDHVPFDPGQPGPGRGQPEGRRDQCRVGRRQRLADDDVRAAQRRGVGRGQWVEDGHGDGYGRQAAHCCRGAQPGTEHPRGARAADDGDPQRSRPVLVESQVDAPARPVHADQNPARRHLQAG